VEKFTGGRSREKEESRPRERMLDGGVLTDATPAVSIKQIREREKRVNR